MNKDKQDFIEFLAGKFSYVWPHKKAVAISFNSNNKIWYHRVVPTVYDGYIWTNNDGDTIVEQNSCGLYPNTKNDEPLFITREEFEHYLITPSDYVEWDGKGTPPVGAECLVGFCTTPLKVVAKSNEYIILRYPNGSETCFIIAGVTFKKPLTKAEQMREDAVTEIMDAMASVGERSINKEAEAVYDAVLKGLIPWVYVKNED